MALVHLSTAVTMENMPDADGGSMGKISASLGDGVGCGLQVFKESIGRGKRTKPEGGQFAEHRLASGLAALKSHSLL